MKENPDNEAHLDFDYFLEVHVNGQKLLKNSLNKIFQKNKQRFELKKLRFQLNFLEGS